MQVRNWNDYQAFTFVTQTEQIARAAKKLSVAATTAGRRTRRLANQIDCTLFEQSREGQSLTEAVEKLLVSLR